MCHEVKLELIFLLPIFLPLLTSIFLFLNKKLFNELVTNFFTLNGALLAFAIAAYSFITLVLDKFKPINVELFQWISNPDISIGFTLDGLSGIMLILVTGLYFVIQLFSTSYMEKDENHCNYFVYFNFLFFQCCYWSCHQTS